MALPRRAWAQRCVRLSCCTQTCAVICSRPLVRTEGRLALLKSLMARQWQPLWTRGWTKGHVYFWPADVENGAVEIIEFFPFLLTVVLVIAFLLRLSFFLVLLQTGTYPGVRWETCSCLWLYRHPTLAMKTKLRSLHVCNSGHAKCRMD